MDIASIIHTQREYFYTGVTRDIQFRKTSLEKLYESVLEQEPAIYAALKQDTDRAEQESYMMEIGPVLSAIRYALKNIDSWTRTEKVKTPRFLFPSKSTVIREPYGVVLIIAH